MRDYARTVQQIDHLDPEIVDAVTSALVCEAAHKFRETIGWVVGHGDPRVNIAGRAAAVGYLFGYFSLDVAAKRAGVNKATMSRLKTQLLDQLELKKEYNQPIREKK